MQVFKKKISKGSRFNQIYIPKELEDSFEVGDMVEVLLIKKATHLIYAGVHELTPFKEDFIRKIFSDLRKHKEINNVFIVGSFLTKTAGYNDIDIVLLVEKSSEQLEKRVEKQLTETYAQKFHVLSFEQQSLKRVLSFSPLIRDMFSKYISSGIRLILPKKKINSDHIRYLLMMSEDLLEVELSNQVFLKNIRKLQTIEEFLGGKKESLDKILEKKQYYVLTKLHNLKKEELKEVRIIIKKKLTNIKKLLHGKKQSN